MIGKGMIPTGVCMWVFAFNLGARVICIGWVPGPLAHSHEGPTIGVVSKKIKQVGSIVAYEPLDAGFVVVGATSCS